MPRSNLAWLLGIIGVGLLGYAATHSAPPREKDRDYELVRLLVDVLDEVDQKYVRQLDPDAKRRLVEDMVNGGLERLDPHSSFISARDYKRFEINSKGKFGGVGIQLGTDRLNSDRLIIVSPMVDTPAFEAGILAGDVIVKIDGKSTENLLVNEAIDLITGDPGTKVTLTVLHEGATEPVDLELTRAEIQVPSVLGDTRKPGNPREWEYVYDAANKIAYLRLVAFSETTGKDMQTVLERLKTQGMRGIILDLRSNPGGLLRAAVEVTRMFLTEGRIVSTKGRTQQEEAYDANGRGAIFVPAGDYPMAVLINRYSASASEIVAAALQDHGRAVIVGERTYGKGSVQHVIPMEGRTSALKLTTASYWRPSGKNIHRFPDSKESDEWGVKPTPGFEFKYKNADLRDFAEYRRNRDIVRGGSVSAANNQKPDKEKKPYVDQALEKALEYVRSKLKNG